MTAVGPLFEAVSGRKARDPVSPGWAVLSPCDTYRYTLGRAWAEGDRCALFICLNPSTADADEDDPTLRRLIGFAKREKCAQLEVVNLFGFRSPKPGDLLTATDPVGPLNDRHVAEAAARAALIVVGWGIALAKPGRGLDLLEARVRAVRELLAGYDLHALGLTADGYPRHPLYLRQDAPLSLFASRRGVA